MTQVQFAKMLADLDPAVLAGLIGKPVAKGEKTTQAQRLANKDKTIRATFTKRGYKDVVLMDRTDPTKEFNVRPFGRKQADGTLTGWLAEGKIVKKGEKAVKGLFHVSQTRDMTVEEVEAL